MSDLPDKPNYLNLESERDRLMTKMIERNDQLIKANEEIDRLKAELESSDHFFGQACKERDLWKSKAERAERQATKLAEALRTIGFAQGNGHPLALMMVARKALDEFEKEGK